MRARSSSRAWWSSSSMSECGHPGRIGPMQNHRRPNVSDHAAEARVSGVYRYEFLLGDINATVLFQLGTLRKASCQLVQEQLCRLHVSGPEPFREAAVNRPQQIARLAGGALIALQACEAGRGLQFPRQHRLPTGKVERFPETGLRRGHGVRGALAQDKLALDAQQLRDAPLLLPALRPFD